MPADQAAGLRRRSEQQPLRCIHCFLDSAEATEKLAHALHRRGWTVLLVDARGRVFSESPTRSLFDWRQQLARGQLHTLPMPYGDGWYALGIAADEPALAVAAQRYEGLLLDAGVDAPGWQPMAGAVQFFIIEVNATQESMLQGYALLKTLSHLEGRVGAGLLGDATACTRLLTACKQFLDPAFSGAVCSVAHEVDAFAALAVRMTGEETGLAARYKTGNT